MGVRISYIEVYSEDPEKTLSFYEKLFLTSGFTGEGSSGGMGLANGYFAITKTPIDGSRPEFGVDVDDLKPFIERLTDAGIQTDPPEEIESGGSKFLQITFKDPDGRLVSLFQPVG